MKRDAIYILIILALSACGPASKLRRAEKLIKKAEQQDGVWTSDTVWVQRRVIVPEIRVDSITIIRPGDSVVIFKDRLEVKIKRLAGDTVFVAGKCLADTVKVEVPVTVTKEIVVHGSMKWYHIVGWSLFALLVGIFFGRVILKMLI